MRQSRSVRLITAGLVLGMAASASAVAQQACFPHDPWGGEVPCMSSDLTACYKWNLGKLPADVGVIESQKMLGHHAAMAGVITDVTGAAGNLVLMAHDADGYAQAGTLYVKVGAAPTRTDFDCRIDAASGQMCSMPRGHGQDVHYRVETGSMPARIHVYAFPG
jgi:hypothetical protein